MKRPSFQFYPADWQANSNLRRCTHEEKGIWLDVLCLLHDQEEYGVVRWPLLEIAQAVGAPIGKLRGIVAKGVLKGADAGSKAPAVIYTPRHGRKDGEPVTLLAEQDGPVWYSSRMLVDEHKRKTAGASTRFTKDDTSPPHGDSPGHAPSRREGDGKGDGSTSSSSSTSSATHKTNPWPGLSAVNGIDFTQWPSLPTEETMRQWLKVRKNKRATNSQIAMDLIRDQLALAAEQGCDAEECIRFAVGRSWSGFKVEWVANEQFREGEQRMEIVRKIQQHKPILEKLTDRSWAEDLRQ